MIKVRIEEGLDKFLQKTQYGFRSKRGTAQALAIIRRILDQAEMSKDKIIFVFLIDLVSITMGHYIVQNLPVIQLLQDAYKYCLTA